MNEDSDTRMAKGQLAWPRCGVSAAIFRAHDVLLVVRGAGTFKGLWSLPGGHIEAGEPARAAALREVREETGVEATLAGLVDVHEVIRHGDAGSLAAHYLIAVFCGRWVAGEPAAASDAAQARFVPVTDIDRLPLTDGAAALIRRAFDIVNAGA